MREVAHHVEAFDARLAQEVNRVRVALAEQGDEEVDCTHPLLSGRLHVNHRALHHSLGGEGRHGRLVCALRQRLQLVQEVVDLAADCRYVATAMAEDLSDVIFGKQGEQEMLQGDELVPPPARLVHRGPEDAFHLGGIHHAGSMVHFRGCSRWRANSCTWTTLVSATSYV